MKASKRDQIIKNPSMIKDPDRKLIKMVDDLLPVMKNEFGKDFLILIRGAFSAGLYLDTKEYFKYSERVLTPCLEVFKKLPKEEGDTKQWQKMINLLKKITKEAE